MAQDNFNFEHELIIDPWTLQKVYFSSKKNLSRTWVLSWLSFSSYIYLCPLRMQPLISDTSLLNLDFLYLLGYSPNLAHDN